MVWPTWDAHRWSLIGLSVMKGKYSTTATVQFDLHERRGEIMVTSALAWQRVDGRLDHRRLTLLATIDQITANALSENPGVARHWRMAPRLVSRPDGRDDMVALCVAPLSPSSGEPPWAFIRELGIRIAAQTWRVSVVVPDVKTYQPDPFGLDLE